MLSIIPIENLSYGAKVVCRSTQRRGIIVSIHYGLHDQDPDQITIRWQDGQITKAKHADLNFVYHEK